jgi:hypothetical protein
VVPYQSTEKGDKRFKAYYIVHVCSSLLSGSTANAARPAAAYTAHAASAACVAASFVAAASSHAFHAASHVSRAVIVSAVFTAFVDSVLIASVSFCLTLPAANHEPSRAIANMQLPSQAWGHARLPSD